MCVHVCDSVPREALWVAFEKLGVPDEVVKFIASFHPRMQAKIRLDGSVSEQFEVSNGLRQDSSAVQSVQLSSDREVECKPGGGRRS